MSSLLVPSVGATSLMNRLVRRNANPQTNASGSPPAKRSAIQRLGDVFRRNGGKDTEKPMSFRAEEKGPLDSLKSKNSSQASFSSVSSTAPQGPVIDPQSLRIDPESLRTFMKKVARVLPTLPAGCSDSATKLHQKVVDELKAIENLAKDPKCTPGTFGLRMRDHFANLAKHSRALAEQLESTGLLGRRNRHCDTAEAFDCLGALFQELKRTHLGAAGPDIAGEYAEKQVTAWEESSPGITTHAQGSLRTSSTGVRARYDIGVGNVGAAFSTNETLMHDDPVKTVDYWRHYGFLVSGGFKGVLGNWSAAISGKGQMNVGGMICEHGEVKELVKFIANHDANRSLFTSANPVVRKLLKKRGDVANAFLMALGRMNTNPSGYPYYLSDAKLEKAFSSRICELARAADHLLCGGKKFSQVIEKAYVLPHRAVRQSLKSNSAMPKEVVKGTVPISEASGHGRTPFLFAWGDVGGVVGKESGGDSPSNFEGGVDFAASVKGHLLRFLVEAPYAPHEVMNGYGRFSERLGLHKQLDGLVAQGDRRLNLYEMVKRHLQGDGKPSTPALTKEEIAHYGDPKDIPAQFHSFITHPTKEKLQSLTAMSQALSKMHVRLMEDVAKFRLLGDVDLPDKLIDKADARARRAFNRINKEIWGNTYRFDEAASDIKKFVAESYLQLSSAMASVATPLHILHERMASQDELRTPENKKYLEMADKAYQTLHEQMQVGMLGLAKEATLKKHNIFETLATWARTSWGVKAEVKGGAKTNLLQAILNRFKKSLGSFTLVNEAGQVAFSAEVEKMNYFKQINPCREGDYIRIKLTAIGGTRMTGQMAAEAVRKALQLAYPGMKPEAVELQMKDLLQEAQSTIYSQSAGGRIVITLRKAPGMKTYLHHYTRGQFLRNSGVDASLKIPLPVGKLTVGASTTDSVERTTAQPIGPCIAANLMSYALLDDVMRLENKGVKDSLKDLLNHPKHQYAKISFFSNEKPFVGIVDQWLEYVGKVKEAADKGVVLKNPAAINEFGRFFGTSPYKEIAELAAAEKRNAAGASARGIDPFSDPVNLLNAVATLPKDFDWQKAKKALTDCTTPEDRITYLTGGGRPVLDFYHSIIGTTKAINTAAIFQIHNNGRSGFATRLKGKKFRARAEQGMNPSASRSPVGELANRMYRAVVRQSFANKMKTWSEEQIKGAMDSPRYSGREKALMRQRLAQLHLGSPRNSSEFTRRMNGAGKLEPDKVLTSSDGQKKNSFNVFKISTSGESKQLTAETSGQAVQATKFLLGQHQKHHGNIDVVNGSASLSGTSPMPDVKSKPGSGGIYQDTTSIMEPTRQWCAKNSVHVAPNHGGGALNCLIVSLLQHATGRYGEQHDKEAAMVRGLLQKACKQEGIEVGDGELLPDNRAYVKLEEIINQRHGTRLKMALFQPTSTGVPFGIPVVWGDAEDRSARVMVPVLQGRSHFEAMTMRASA